MIKTSIILRVIVPILALTYIIYPSRVEKIEKLNSETKTIVKSFDSKGVDYAKLSTFKSSWFISMSGSDAIFTMQEKRISEVSKNIESVLVWNDWSDICMVNNYDLFWATQTWKTIIEKHWNELLAMAGSWLFVDPKWAFWIPNNVIVAKNPQTKLLDSIEFEKYFWKYGNDVLWKRILSKIPFNAGNWTFLWYDFKNNAYAYSLVENIVTMDEVRGEQWTWTHLIFVASKSKKSWNWLIISEYNNSILKLLLGLFNKKELSISDIDLENENISLKKSTYWSVWFYSNVKEYSDIVLNFSQKQWKPSSILYEEWDRIILETEDEYLFLFFDKADSLLSSRKDIVSKIAVSKKSYQIGETIYLLDKNRFIVKTWNMKDCDFIVRNGAVSKNGSP